MKEKRLALLLCQAKEDRAGSCPWEHVSQLGEDTQTSYSHGSKRTPSAVDILLMGWCFKQQSAPLTFRSDWSEICMPVGSTPSLIINFSPPGWDFSICKTTQRYCCVCVLWGKQDPFPRLHDCLLTVPPLSLVPLPPLINNCSKSAHWNSREGHGG